MTDMFTTDPAPAVPPTDGPLTESIQRDTAPGVPPTKTLRERIQEDYAPAWRPEEGDTIVGFVTEISVGNSDYGDYPIVTIYDPQSDTRQSVHAFHSTLQSSLIDAQPSIGEEVAVKYSGLRVPKPMLSDGQVPNSVEKKFGTKDDPRYHDYKVIVNRAPADVWGNFKKKEPRS